MVQQGSAWYGMDSGGGHFDELYMSEFIKISGWILKWYLWKSCHVMMLYECIRKASQTIGYVDKKR